MILNMFDLIIDEKDEEKTPLKQIEFLTIIHQTTKIIGACNNSMKTFKIFFLTVENLSVTLKPLENLSSVRPV